MPQIDSHGRSYLIHRAARERSGRVQPYASIPMGYRTETEKGPTKAVLDGDKAALVREAFLRMAEGNDPLRKVLAAVTEKGLVSKMGKPLGVSSFWHILTDPFYCGVVILNGTTLRGLHEPTVSRHVFDRVQLNLRRRSRRKQLKLQKVYGATKYFP